MVVTVRVRVALGVDRLSQMVAQELAVHVPGRELRRLVPAAVDSFFHQVADLAMSTAWSYFARAAVHVPGRELRRLVPPLVGRRLWTALQRLEGRALLGGPLTELMAALGRLDRTLAGGERISDLRLARMALTAG